MKIWKNPFKSYLDLIPWSGRTVIGDSGVCSVVVVDINVRDLNIDWSRWDSSCREVIWFVPSFIWWISAVWAANNWLNLKYKISLNFRARKFRLIFISWATQLISQLLDFLLTNWVCKQMLVRNVYFIGLSNRGLIWFPKPPCPVHRTLTNLLVFGFQSYR